MLLRLNHIVHAVVIQLHVVHSVEKKASQSLVNLISQVNSFVSIFLTKAYVVLFL